MSVPKPQIFRLFLLRHAQASWASPGERDFDRRLDQTGYMQAEFTAERAADKAYRPDLILCSTAVRCRQTVEALKRAFSGATEIAYVDEMYDAQPEIYLDLVDGQRDIRSLMLVGHNPTMEGTLEALIGHAAMEAAIPNGFPTAGLAVLEAMPQHGDKGPQWQLLEFLTP